MEINKTCNTCKEELPAYKFYNGYKKDGTRKLLAQCHHCRYKDRISKDPSKLWRDGIKKRYGLTLEKYDELAAAANYSCEICKEPSDRLTVDHDHSCCSGELTCGWCVRGLLCGKCNRGIGQFNDDIRLLEAAIAYLKTKTPA